MHFADRCFPKFSLIGKVSVTDMWGGLVRGDEDELDFFDVASMGDQVPIPETDIVVRLKGQKSLIYMGIQSQLRYRAAKQVSSLPTAHWLYDPAAQAKSAGVIARPEAKQESK